MDTSEFYIPLNLPDIRTEINEDYIAELFNLQKQGSHLAFMSFLDKEIPKTALDLLNNLGLTPCHWKTNLFTSGRLTRQELHLDGHPEYEIKFRPFAINWVWGGVTFMEWFRYNKQKLPDPFDWQESKYIVFDEQDCTRICKAVLTGVNLVNISHPHRVTNASKEQRFCFSICSNEILHWSEIKELCYKHGLITS
jgi:hypothetical protein